MTISVENKEGSEIALLEPAGEGAELELVPFAFPDQTVPIAAGIIKYLTRVPLLESSEGDSLTSLKGAREAIPVEESMGKGLDGYIIESLPEGQGGVVNGVSVEVRVPIEDAGIIFVAD